MPDLPNPKNDAAAAFRAGWVKFMDDHNQSSRANYTDTFGPKNPANFINAYHKLLQTTSFPTPKTAVISLFGFTPDETTALLTYLDEKKIHSTMEWAPQPNTVQITIREGHNTHLDFSPVQIIMRDQKLAQETAQKAAKEAADKAALLNANPLYIPPFNVKDTDRRFHIFLDYMHPADQSLLAKALQSRNVDFIQEESEEYGHVYTIRFKYFEELSKMKKECRSEENRQRDPQHARLYVDLSQNRPTINILRDGEKLCIPLEGMPKSHIEKVEDKLAYLRLPYELKNNDDYGPVFSIDEKYMNNLDGLSVMLRAEYRMKKRADMAKMEAQPSSSPNGMQPA